MLAITNGGFHVKFKNGVTASVQFGYGAYCERKNTVDAPPQSKDAEVAAWDEKGAWITKALVPGSFDDVIGHLNADQVVDFLVKAKEWEGETK